VFGAFVKGEALDAAELELRPSRRAMMARNSAKIGSSWFGWSTTCIRQHASGTKVSSGKTLNTASSVRVASTSRRMTSGPADWAG